MNLFLFLMGIIENSSMFNRLKKTMPLNNVSVVLSSFLEDKSVFISLIIKD